MTDDVRSPSAPETSEGRPVGALVAAVLLLAPAIDELCSAAPTVGAPDLRLDLALSITGLFVFGTVIPVLAAMLLEPFVIQHADGPWRRAVLLGSGAAWWAGYLVCAAAPGPWVLAGGLSTTFIAGGVALGVARASLVAGSPDIERALTRWTLAASIGDLAGPLALAGIAWLGGGWRVGMLGCALAVGAWWVGVLRVPVGHPDDEEEDERPSLREALQDRRLMAWLSAVALCTLLDEIFVAGVALYATDVLDVGLSAAALLVSAEMTGGVVGLLVFERLEAPARALIPACALSLLGLLGTVLAPGPWTAACALFVCGVGVGPQYPLALAAAHRARPGLPGQVEALQEAFIGVELVFPLVFGIVADQLGLGAALLFLGLQPVGIGLIAWAVPRGDDPTPRATLAP